MWLGDTHGWSVAGTLVTVLVVAGCSDVSGSMTQRPHAVTSLPAGETTSSSDPVPSATTGENCPPFEGQPLRPGETTQLVQLGEVNGAVVRAAVYPRPDYQGNPWSQWGQGIVLDDGRFFSAIGDHLGADGNSFIYVYDPETNTLASVGDILSYVDHVPGTWGYGKIHSQMVSGICDEIYFSTYWGTFRGIEFEGNYRGDIVFRLDPWAGTLAPLDVPVEFHGQASLASAPRAGLIYGEAVDPVLKEAGIDRGPFFAYDIVDEETEYVGADSPHIGYRSVLVDAGGIAFYSVGESTLARFDPATGEETTHDHRLPGEWLRASTQPGPEGHVYGVTHEPDRFFVMNPDGDIEDLGEALGYTASVALTPDGSAFFYMPGAHGNSAEWGSPMIRVDTDTGDQTVVAELNPLVEEGLGYTVGGTYDVAVAPDGNTVYMGSMPGWSATSRPLVK